MKCKAVISFLVISLVTVSFAYGGEWVTFKGNSATGESLTLKGILEKPEGKGPFPAVVMLHGCSGIEGMKKFLDIWAQRLTSWGYVTLMVDSFGPRGESDICGGTRVFLIPPNVRAQDAHDARSYLSGLPIVNRDQIALMGWSHGGWTVLYSIDETFPVQNRGDPFRTAIAFYPYCSIPLRGFDSPLLILSGELDDWCPPAMCQMRMASGTTTPEVTLKIYPGATHGFDFEGVDKTKNGHRILYNPEATKDAIEQVRNFLTKYLK
jgi:dienelactone hydrolase